MRIVHLVEAWKGGIATYVTTLIDSQIKSGHEVYLVCDREKHELDIRPTLATMIFYKSSRNPVHFFQISTELLNIFQRLAPDVIHAHSTFSGIYSRIRRNHRSKLIYTPHAWSFLKRDSNFITRAIYRAIETNLSRNCDRILCMSLEEVATATKAGIDPGMLDLVYTGIPDEPARHSITNPSNSDDVLNVGFFGRFDFQKGYDLLVKATDYLRPEIHIHAFGDTVISSSAPSHPRIRVHGWLPHAEINAKMAEMDAVVVPSRWEGFALTSIEAMRAGTTVVGSNLSSIPEVLIHGFNGILLAEYTPKALAIAINSLTPSICRELGRNARTTYERTFTFQRYIDSMESVYNTTVFNQRRPLSKH